MGKFLDKLRSYIYQPINVDGEEMKMGFKTIEPSEKASFINNSMTPGDRKRHFNNFNQNLLNRISDIKSTNS